MYSVRGSSTDINSNMCNMYSDKDSRKDKSSSLNILHRKVFRRTMVFLLAVLCVTLAGVSPALAKSSKKSRTSTKAAHKTAAKKHSKKSRKKPGISSAHADWAPHWYGGVWENGCYVDDNGEVLVSLEEEDRKPFLKLRGLKHQHILYIGASHVPRTHRAVKDKDVYFYGTGGAGFKWFFRQRYGKNNAASPAYQVIRSYLHKFPTGTVIIDLGGNDFVNIDLYVGFYRDLLRRYPSARFYFKTPMPHEIGRSTNGGRRDFGMRIGREFPANELNLFDELYTMPGFHTADGVHFSKKMYRIIYEMTMEKIGRRITVNMKTGAVHMKKGTQGQEQQDQGQQDQGQQDQGQQGQGQQDQGQAQQGQEQQALQSQ